MGYNGGNFIFNSINLFKNKYNEKYYLKNLEISYENLTNDEYEGRKSNYIKNSPFSETPTPKTFQKNDYKKNQNRNIHKSDNFIYNERYFNNNNTCYYISKNGENKSGYLSNNISNDKEDFKNNNDIFFSNYKNKNNFDNNKKNEEIKINYFKGLNNIKGKLFVNINNLNEEKENLNL